jgi:hypothetical protein
MRKPYNGWGANSIRTPEEMMESSNEQNEMYELVEIGGGDGSSLPVTGDSHAKNSFEFNGFSHRVSDLGHEHACSVKSGFYWLQQLVRCDVLGKPILC